MEEWSKKVNIKFQQLLDKSAPFKLYRWLGLGALVALYAVRIFSIKGFYIITYALGIYNLNLLLGFISPSTDPELDGPVLPSRSDDEYRPFVRRLQEMKFWMMSSRAFLIGLTATLFPFLDIPVFWPILLMYWLVLVGITMRRQIKHMIKYKYLPFDFGKQSHDQKQGK